MGLLRSGAPSGGASVRGGASRRGLPAPTNSFHATKMAGALILVDQQADTPKGGGVASPRGAGPAPAPAASSRTMPSLLQPQPLSRAKSERGALFGKELRHFQQQQHQQPARKPSKQSLDIAPAVRNKLKSVAEAAAASPPPLHPFDPPAAAASGAAAGAPRAAPSPLASKSGGPTARAEEDRFDQAPPEELPKGLSVNTKKASKRGALGDLGAPTPKQRGSMDLMVSPGGTARETPKNRPSVELEAAPVSGAGGAGGASSLAAVLGDNSQRGGGAAAGGGDSSLRRLVKSGSTVSTRPIGEASKRSGLLSRSPSTAAGTVGSYASRRTLELAAAEEADAINSTERFVGSALVFAFLYTGRIQRFRDLAFAQRLTALLFKGQTVRGLTFSTLVDYFKVLLNDGNINYSKSWFDRARLWRVVFLGNKSGYCARLRQRDFPLITVLLPSSLLCQSLLCSQGPADAAFL